MSVIGESWRGERPLAKVFWAYYVGFSFAYFFAISSLAGFIYLSPQPPLLVTITLIACLLPFWPYHIWIYVSVWRCAKNSKPVWMVLARTWIIFSIIQIASVAGLVFSKTPGTSGAIWDKYFEIGRYDLAIKEINRQLQMHPNDPMSYVPYNDRGEAYRLKGQLDLAIADYNKAIAINPKFARAYSNRGIAYRFKGDFDQAISDYDKALEIEPTFAQFYANRAVAYYYKGKYDKAWDDVYSARKLGKEVTQEFLTNLRQASGREK